MKKITAFLLALLLCAVSALADGQSPAASPLEGTWNISEIRMGVRRTLVSPSRMAVELSVAGSRFSLALLPVQGDSRVLEGSIAPVNKNTYHAAAQDADGIYDLTFVLNGNKLTLMVLQNGSTFAFLVFTPEKGYILPTATPVYAPTAAPWYWPTATPAPWYWPTPEPWVDPTPVGWPVAPYHWSTRFVLGMSKYSEKVDRSATLYRLYDDDPRTFYHWTIWSSDRSSEIPEFTAYFSRASISAFGIRNGNLLSEADYFGNARPRTLKLDIYYGGRHAVESISIPDQYMNDYQVFPLRETYYDVSRIEIWMQGFTKGDTKDGIYCCTITDVQFYQ